MDARLPSAGGLKARSLIEALRDDSKGALRDDTPTRHPDNVLGQDLGLCRVFETRSRAKVLNRNDSGQALRDDPRGAKKGKTIGAGQSLFSLTAISGFSFLSVKRFLEHDAETSS